MALGAPKGLNFKDALNQTIGPLAVLTAASATFVKSMAGAALNAQKMREALAASAEASNLTTLFTTLMGNAEMARVKVAELTEEAAKSPFAFEALGKAALNLQVLSKGSFDSAKALKQVQDVAAATGTPVDAVAAAMGGLMGALKTGSGGAEAAAQQLAAMGAVSERTATRIAELASAGAPASEALRLLEADAKKTQGAAAALATTMEGLQQQMANRQEASDARIGDMFKGASEAGARASAAMQEFRNSVAEAAAAPWAALLGGFNAVKEGAANFLAQVGQTGAAREVFRALSAVAVGALGVLVATLLAATKAIFGFVAGLRVVQAAIAGLAVTTKAWAALMFTATGGLTALAAALAYVAMKALQARSEIRAMNEELQNARADSSRAAGTLSGQAAGVKSPEDLDEAKSAAKEAVANAQRNVESARARLKEAQQSGGFGRDEKIAVAQRGLEQAEQGLDKITGFAQQILSIDQQLLALDAKRTEEARTRAALERQILEEARTRAAEMGAGSMEAFRALKDESAQRRADAEVASAEIDKGNRAITEVQTSRPAVGQSDRERELATQITEKEDALREMPGRSKRGARRQVQQEIEDLQAQRAEAAGASQAGALEAAFNKLRSIEQSAPATDGGVVTAASAQIAQRTLLNDAERDAREVIDTGFNPRREGATADDTEAQVEMAAARALLAAVEKLERAIGGPQSRTGAAIQAIEFRRDDARQRVDPVSAITSDAERDAGMQGQALAAAEAEYSMQRLRNEQMILQLKQTAAGIAAQEYEQQIAAANELKAAQDEMAASNPGAERRRQEAEAKAEEAGVGGRSAAELKEEREAFYDKVEPSLDATRAGLDAFTGRKDEFDKSTADESLRELDSVLRTDPNSDKAKIAVEASGLESVQELLQAIEEVQRAASTDRKLSLQIEAAEELEAAREAANPIEAARKRVERAEAKAEEVGVGGRSAAELQKAFDEAKAADGVIGKGEAAWDQVGAAIRDMPDADGNPLLEAPAPVDQGTLSKPAQDLEALLRTDSSSQAAQVAVEASGLESVEELLQALEDLKKAAEAWPDFVVKIRAAEELEGAKAAVEAARLNPEDTGTPEERAAAERRYNVARANAKRLGVEDLSPEQLEEQRRTAEMRQSKALSERGQGAQLAALRVQEQMGPNATAAKKEADDLEDSMEKKRRAVELGTMVKDPAQAMQLASAEVDMERAIKNINSTQQPRMSEMAQVGGSAGWAGLVTESKDPMKEVIEAAKAIQQVIQRMDIREGNMEQWAKQQQNLNSD